MDLKALFKDINERHKLQILSAQTLKSGKSR
jgi:hypothetical protein